MSRSSPSPIELANLLFGKYKLHKDDVHLHMQSFNNHVRNLQIAGSFALPATTYFLFNPSYAPTNDNKFVWLSFIFVLVTFSCYLLHDVLYASFQIFYVAARMATIEEKINEIIRNDFFLWESGLVREFNSTAFNPSFYRIFYGIILFLILIGGIPAFVLWKTWRVATTDAGTFKALSILMIGYASISFLVVLVMIWNLLINLPWSSHSLIRNFIAKHTKRG